MVPAVPQQRKGQQMRKLVLATVSTLALALAPACGDDDNGNGNGNGDTPDAAPMIDVMQGNPPVEGLGQVCSQVMPCSLPATDCIGFREMPPPTEGFCTLSCAVDDGMGGMTGSDAVCASNYSGPGTPACVFVDNLDNPTTFSCGILCQSDADCPGGTDCTNLGAGSACIPPGSI
jgi:hypothetical protein